MSIDRTYQLDFVRYVASHDGIAIQFEKTGKTLRPCAIEWVGWNERGQIELVVGDECECHRDGFWDDQEFPDQLDGTCYCSECKCEIERD